MFNLLGRKKLVEATGLTAASATHEFDALPNAKGARFAVDASNQGGDADETLDIDVQVEDVFGNWHTIASFTQLGGSSATLSEDVLIYPGTGNGCIGHRMRFSVSTGGTTPDYDYSLGVEWLG